MPPIPDLEQLVADVGARAAGPDPLDQLAVAAEDAATLQGAGDALLDHFVALCRGAGHSWAEISAVMGVSRQAAHKRFAAAVSPVPGGRAFTPRARAVLEDATREARERGSGAVGPEDLLLALFDPPEAIAAQVLAEAGLSRAATRAAVDADPAGRRPPSDHPAATGATTGFAPETIAVIRRAVAESLALGHNYVGTEHLLLALAPRTPVPGADGDSDPGTAAGGATGAGATGEAPAVDLAERLLAVGGLDHDTAGHRIGAKLGAFTARLAGPGGRREAPSA